MVDRKMVKAAVIEEDQKETLVSLELLKKWDLIHSSFPFRTISDYIDKKMNKKYQAYSTFNNFQQSPQQECRKNEGAQQ